MFVYEKDNPGKSRKSYTIQVVRRCDETEHTKEPIVATLLALLPPDEIGVAEGMSW